MVSEIRVYVEGGGDYKEGKANLREGFTRFLASVVEEARSHRIQWRVVPCGSRDRTLDAFRTAVEQHRDAFNVLLVDAEGPVRGSPKSHLTEGGAHLPHDTSLNQCHCMVQMMEAWLVADTDALSRFYGQGFRIDSIPRTQNVEEIAKPDLEKSLRNATERTKKGKYHKIRHGAELLKRIDYHKVEERADSCRRLFSVLLSEVAGSE